MKRAAAVVVGVALLALQGCDNPVRIEIRPVSRGAAGPESLTVAAAAPARPASARTPVAKLSVTPASGTPRADVAPLAREPAEPARQAASMGGLPARGSADGASLLAARRLIVPVQGIAPTELVDSYLQARGKRTHEAIDIMAPRGTPVYAVDDGTVAKLFTSKAGGLTVYHFDAAGELTYYYAHLDRYADGLKEGMKLRRGDLVGYVGVTGNSDPDAPHLHFAVFRLGEDRRWWKGDPVNPYPALRKAAPAPVMAAAR